jgi:hypothetical protein
MDAAELSVTIERGMASGAEIRFEHKASVIV